MNTLTEAVRRIKDHATIDAKNYEPTDLRGRLLTIGDEVDLLLAEPAATQAEPIRMWHDRIKDAHPRSNPEYWPSSLKAEYMEAEILELRAAVAILALRPAPVAEPVASEPKPHGCAECGKTSTAESMWALYCVDCIRTKVGPALAAAEPPQPVAALPMTCPHSNRSDCALFDASGKAARPSKEWYAAKIQETFDDDFIIGSELPPQPVAQGDYPPLPPSVFRVDAGYTAAQVYAAIDADRAARSKREEVRKPLTKDQVDFILGDAFLAANGSVYSTRVYDFVKAIEREHGIAAAPTTSGGEQP